MALTLHYHPLSSHCHKVLVGAAAPTLFYAHTLETFPEQHRHLHAYFEKLIARPSVQRVLAQAQPYFPMYPFHSAIPARFL